MSKLRHFIAEVPKIILFVLLFLMAILFSVFNADSAESIQNSACVAEIDLDLSVISVDDEHMKVGLSYKGDEILCGALLELVFDPAICKISSVCDGAGLGESARITCFEEEGKVILLLDSFSGIGSGELAVVGFSLLSATDTDVDVSISGDCGSACIIQNGALKRAHVSKELLSFKRESGGSGSHDTVNLSLSDDGRMTFSGDTSHPCSFLGFDVTVTDIYGSSSQNFTVSSRACQSGVGAYTATADLPCGLEENCVVAVRAVRYERDGTIYGEEKIFVLRRGGFCCVGEDE